MIFQRANGFNHWQQNHWHQTNWQQTIGKKPLAKYHWPLTIGHKLLATNHWQQTHWQKTIDKKPMAKKNIINPTHSRLFNSNLLLSEFTYKSIFHNVKPAPRNSFN